MASYFLLPLCGRLRREIQRKAKRIQYHICAERLLHHFPILERETIPRYWSQLGIPKPRRPPIHAKICCEFHQTFPPQTSTKTTRSTLPPHQDHLWGKGTIPPRCGWLHSSDTTRKSFVQEVTGTFLYYTGAVDATMLTALGSIETQQANPTKNTMKKSHSF